jgi:hypothetical protein
MTFTAESACTVCRTPVERHAARCPNCGLSHPTRVLARGGLWLVTFAILVVWAATLATVLNAR